MGKFIIYLLTTISFFLHSVKRDSRRPKEIRNPAPPPQDSKSGEDADALGKKHKGYFSDEWQQNQKSIAPRNHPFGTYGKSSEEIPFFTPYTHTYEVLSGGKKC